MNIWNLKKLKEILNQTKPSDFDMKNVYNSETGTKCIIGIYYTAHNPEVVEDNRSFHHNACSFFDKEMGFTLFNNKRLYLIAASWGDENKTNTLDHAIYRIQKIIDGYEPEYYEFEIKKELK